MKLKREVFIVLVFSLLILLLALSLDIEKQIIELKYEVGDKAGFNIGTTELNFGKLIPGSIGTRSINVANLYEDKIWVKFYPSDSIKKEVSYELGWIPISPNSSLNASFSIIVPLDKPEGNYSGYIGMRIFK